MENASKALIMAGSILISMIIIALLVAFYNNLRSLEQTKSNSNQEEQITEINKQFTEYQRIVYGSEILSLANKVEYYNQREADNKGYKPIVLIVTIGNGKGIDNTFFSSGTYNISTNNQLQKQVNELRNLITTYESKENKNKNTTWFENGNIKLSVAEIATMRTNEWEEKLGLDEKISAHILTITKIKNLSSEYLRLKNIESEFKQKKFKCTNFEYDGGISGRIEKMTYEMI